MKRIVTVTLEFDISEEDKNYFTEDQIKEQINEDLRTEIGSCWHHPEIIEITIDGGEREIWL